MDALKIVPIILGVGILISAIVYVPRFKEKLQKENDFQEKTIKQLDEINQRLNQLESTNMQLNELQREE